MTLTPISRVGGFSFFVFLNPWASIVKDMRVWCIAPDFLFKSIWARCDLLWWLKFYAKIWCSAISEIHRKVCLTAKQLTDPK